MSLESYVFGFLVFNLSLVGGCRVGGGGSGNGNESEKDDGLN